MSLYADCCQPGWRRTRPLTPGTPHFKPLERHVACKQLELRLPSSHRGALRRGTQGRRSERARAPRFPGDDSDFESAKQRAASMDARESESSQAQTRCGSQRQAERARFAGVTDWEVSLNPGQCKVKGRGGAGGGGSVATVGHAFRDAGGPSGNEQARADASRGPCRTWGARSFLRFAAIW